MKSIAISLTAQRKRLLEHLKEYRSVTTYEAREQLGIAHPAGRIRELREQGYLIHKSVETLTDGYGVKHPRSARYFLLSEEAANDE